MCSSDHSHPQEFRVLPHPDKGSIKACQDYAALESQVLPHLKGQNDIRVTTRRRLLARALETSSTSEWVNNSLDDLFQVGEMLLGSEPQKHIFLDHDTLCPDATQD